MAYGMKLVFSTIIFIIALVSAQYILGKDESTKNCWVDAGTRYQIDPWLLYSIAQQESSLNPLAVNHRAAWRKHSCQALVPPLPTAKGESVAIAMVVPMLR